MSVAQLNFSYGLLYEFRWFIYNNSVLMVRRQGTMSNPDNRITSWMYLKSEYKFRYSQE